MTLRPDWPTCQFPGPCVGIQIEQKRCLAHLDAEFRRGFLATLGPGSVADFRGTPFTEALLEEVLARFEVPNKPAEPLVGDVDFTGARFEGIARFGEVRFTGRLMFRHAVFVDQVLFNRTVFAEGVDFADALFEGVVRFSSAATEADFDFRRVRFERSVDFEMVRVRDLFLDEARFSERGTMVVEAREISCSGTRFEEGVALSVQYGQIAAARTVFGAASGIGYPAEILHRFATLRDRKLVTGSPWPARVMPGPRRACRRRRARLVRRPVATGASVGVEAGWDGGDEDHAVHGVHVQLAARALAKLVQQPLVHTTGPVHTVVPLCSGEGLSTSGVRN